MILLFLQNQIPCFQVTEEQAERFEKLLPANADLPVRICRSEEEFLSFLPEATAVFVWTFKQEWFEIARKLRHLCTPAAGRDYFRVSPPEYVTLHYGSFHGKIMGETALACILAVSHGILPFAGKTGGAQSTWPRVEMARCARRIAGSNVLILGFGNIGRTFAEMLLPFGPSITGVTRGFHADLKDEWAAKGVTVETAASLDSLLPQADHVVSFLPSGEETTDLFDATRLSRMKQGAFLYNFGRGNLIDEKALAMALSSRSIGGAVLDVLKTEPLTSPSPLAGLDNCWLFPHASAFSPDYLDLYFEKAAAAMREYA